MRQMRNPLSRRERTGLVPIYWRVVAIVFTLARFSEAFLILRAAGCDLSPIFVPLVLVVLSIA